MNHDLPTVRSASGFSMLILTVAACKGNPPQSPTAPSAQSPVPPAAASVPTVTNWERLPVPAVAPPLNRKHAATVRVELETRAVKGLLADGVGYEFWTYNGTVPGPMIRVRVGDTVDLIVRNSLGSAVSHSIDSHAVTGPGGGGKVTQTPPGKASEFRFKALNPGVFIYHCATPMIPYHIAHGMYGLMVVEPAQGWPKVDR